MSKKSENGQNNFLFTNCLKNESAPPSVFLELNKNVIIIYKTIIFKVLDTNHTK